MKQTFIVDTVFLTVFGLAWWTGDENVGMIGGVALWLICIAGTLPLFIYWAESFRVSAMSYDIWLIFLDTHDTLSRSLTKYENWWFMAYDAVTDMLYLAILYFALNATGTAIMYVIATIIKFLSLYRLSYMSSVVNLARSEVAAE